MGQVNRYKTPSANNAIGASKRKIQSEYEQLNVAFSFAYLDLIHQKFNSANYPETYFKKFSERLKEISKIKFKTFVSDPHLKRTLHSHPIKWEDTAEKAGFNLSGQKDLADQPWQFSVTVNEHGRVHGFWIENIFHIVWYDLNHALYP